MRVSEIETQLKARPFVPVRMHFSDGSHHDIRHPEMAMVTRTVIVIAIYERPDQKTPEHAIFCDPMHVTRLERIDGER